MIQSGRLYFLSLDVVLLVKRSLELFFLPYEQSVGGLFTRATIQHQLKPPAGGGEKEQKDHLNKHHRAPQIAAPFLKIEVFAAETRRFN